MTSIPPTCAASSRPFARPRPRATAGSCAQTPALLSRYTSCPDPAENADDGGATTGIDSFAEVAQCLIALTDAEIGELAASAIGEPDAVLEDDLLRCQTAISEGVKRITKRYLHDRRLCQRRLDQDGGGLGYACDGQDPEGRIVAARAHVSSAIAGACNLPQAELAMLDSCGDTVAELQQCVIAEADETGAELIRYAYGLPDPGSGTPTTTLDPTTTTLTGPTTTLDAPTTTLAGPTTTLDQPTTTVTSPTTTLNVTTTTLAAVACTDSFPACNGSCGGGQFCQEDSGACQCAAATGACEPATIIRTFNGKYDTPPTQTSLSVGWSGNVHDVEIPNDSRDVVDVTCDENCQSCVVSLNVQEGSPVSNCRCTSNPQTTCTEINGSDPDSCGSLDPTCRCYFGAPLPLSAGGTPVCVVNRIREDYSGTMNLRTGEWDYDVRLASVVYLGLDTIHPCPTCDGDTAANDGVRDGICNGGLSSGSCDVNGEHATLGPTSFDCLPASATNISGTGLLLELHNTTGTQTLEANLPCDTPSGAQCPCRVCSGNASVGCASNADCQAVDAGACTASGGAGVQPNQCEGYECGQDGRCTTGPIDTYCDAVTHPDGRGFVPCNDDSDCSASGGGSCSVIDVRRCFPDPIVVQGEADPGNPLTAAAFCIPPTTNPAVNLSGGIPGPGTLRVDFDLDIRCQNNPAVAYELPSGANCAGTATTSTTLLPLPACVDAVSPICGGACPVGQTCTDAGGTCGCTGLPLPSCDEAMAPLCGGLCAEPGEVCTDDGGTCECQPPTLPQCADAISPVCGGQCPVGELCLDVAGTCQCQAPGLPACGSATAPVCAGVCDVGQLCTASGDTCTCLAVLPPCGQAASPVCAGSCPVGAICTDNAGTCGCMSLLP
ncbi:MAG TPA: hypothetical protein VEL28_13385 [Candidatus Binatia bacterium]|nr:hypothetical protein [Candidatus Binatia bacterium]